MREIEASAVMQAVKEMCIEANYYLSGDVKDALYEGYEQEISALGKEILGQLKTNLNLAMERMIPICQDTGMTVVFAQVGQQVHVVGGDLGEAIQQGVREGYEEGYLRKSVVRDPFDRVNTGDNTPAIIHYEIVPGDQLSLTVAPKGAGSENMSRIYMLKPADGEEGMKKAVLEAVKLAGPNACPPLVVGVGIGGNFETCALLAKKALVRPIGTAPANENLARLEKELLSAINATGIGPGGLGGRTTALAVHLESYATHIASLPVAVNICCHVNRHVRRVVS